METERTADARLRRRLGNLLRRRGGSPQFFEQYPAELARHDIPRRDRSGSLPGHEKTNAFGNLHIYEFVRGRWDPGYESLLRRLAEASDRLELVADTELVPEFVRVKRYGLAPVLLLDLETSGFAGSAVLLAGLLTIEPDCVRVRQFLARSYPEEGAVIAEVAAAVAQAELLVTYNGKSFDVPMLADRASRHGVAWRSPPAHLDLLHHARRAYRDRSPNCRLVTLEWTICGRRRFGDVGGRDIPGLLHRFTRDGDPSAVVPVLHHNALDLVTLADLLSHLVPYPPGPRLVLDGDPAEALE